MNEKSNEQQKRPWPSEDEWKSLKDVPKVTSSNEQQKRHLLSGYMVVPGVYRVDLRHHNDIYQYAAYLYCEAFKVFEGGVIGPLQSYAAIYKMGNTIPLYSKWYDGCIIRDLAIAQKVLTEFVNEFNNTSTQIMLEKKGKKNEK